ncbi:MAG: NADH:ubiquinone oxidoreductase [Chloroflexi bacterium]|nr:NADH:ubiquinone oxidoreductase [Chloroflexota bacterium]
MKPKIAFFDFTSCEGCQLTVVDSLQTNVGLLDMVEIVQFREAMTEKGTDYQIAFVEGSCTRESDEDRLRAIREQADVVVALGACAHLGGINAIRNIYSIDEVRDEVYGDKGEWYETYQPRPIDAVIAVDAVIPGCPIDRDEFIAVVTQVLQGREPRIPDHPVCIECKLNETVCMYLRGEICLGPISRAGCGAICPKYGFGCVGCRGMISNPNLESMEEVLEQYGRTLEEARAKMSMFLTYQTLEEGES